MPESKISNTKLMPLFVGIPAFIVLVAVIFIVAGRREAPHLTMPPQKVVLGTVEARDITDTLEYVAVMEADNMVDLRARVAGFLVAKNFEDGDLVRDRQVLFQIEPDQYQALVDNAEGNVLSAQAHLDLATLDFNRISDLYRKNTSPKSDFDKAKADYEMAQAALMSAKATLAQSRLNLGYASIKAPFDGQASDTPYSEGSLLGPDSGVLATVVSVDPILATFGISDKIITAAHKENLAQDQTLSDWQVRLRLGPDNYYPEPGQFSYVSPTVDPKTDTVKFKAKFKNPDKILRPGQIVTAVMERTNSERRLVVPKEAVLTDPDGNYMLMPKETPADPKVPGSRPGLVAEARRITLESGDALDKEYIVKDGLSEGEKFILKGLMSAGAMLRPGAAITVAEPEAAPASPADSARPKEGEA
ncbi:MAG: efflux RND transporter periplasmic adaptor subunit [Candidatus Adiutrix sp.]|jgi:membrane fusion protein (multidrug efflux system)|nr:efflux RND transporter periplasmic adaptor subunit [Candidatus Adiutrix sp.]